MAEGNESSAGGAQTWLVVERYENWLVDKSDGFSKFGLSERLRARADKVRSGDTLIVYVSSGISAFSDVRSVTSDGVTRLKFGGDYDTAFPICLKTTPILTLEKPAWVPIKGLFSELSFTQGKNDWRQVMRNALRVLAKTDTQIIMSRMEASRNESVEAV